MCLTITEFFYCRIENQKGETFDSNYVFILALDNFVGFKYSHAWKNKYEHPGIKHSA